MFVALPGMIVAKVGGFPPYGTLLSSNCSGYTAHDSGPETYTDALGNVWADGMYNLWEELADGDGGSFWLNSGANSGDIYSSCWLPYGYCISLSSEDVYTYWVGCGSDGYFGPVGTSFNNVFADGSGGTYSDSGLNYSTPPYSGDLIYDNGSGCCYVYYDGSGGYYVSDTCGSCPEAGTLLYNGCASTDGNDASGAYFTGSWTYGEYLADGMCGEYFNAIGDDQDGCYHPYGWKFDYSTYSNSLHWEVFDSNSSLVAYNDVEYENGWSSSAIADGSGGTFSDGSSWSFSDGELIASGTYFDSGYGQDYGFEIYYVSPGGYYANQWPL